MLTFEQRKAAVSKALEEIEKGIEQLRYREQVAKNWAAMTQVQRNAYLGAIKAKLNRLELEIAIAQAKQAAQRRPVARKTAPACNGIVCGHMRTPTGGRR
jgi:acyl-CoA reductase-like NAD-dependent aldehyde dehydrogenase